ncbi:phage tail tape measure protein [Staphylococcus pseudintermedius]|uniref:phage tail tape measure protein n=1 Tax=Staphylococcus pseudintermedius TaxID=283734 RepID=UPI00192879D6
MKDNLKGALEQLNGAFESLSIQIGKDLTPTIRKGAEWLTQFTEGFSKLPNWVRKGSAGLLLFGATIGPVSNCPSFELQLFYSRHQNFLKIYYKH